MTVKTQRKKDAEMHSHSGIAYIGGKRITKSEPFAKVETDKPGQERIVIDGEIIALFNYDKNTGIEGDAFFYQKSGRKLEKILNKAFESRIKGAVSKAVEEFRKKAIDICIQNKSLFSAEDIEELPADANKND